ncbi:MAG: guanylate kinase [Actinobacteria bacterium]|nr:guanylate kinase [Actinomycetota bacterium]
MVAKGKAIIISGPSGAGKTTLIRSFLELKSGYHFAISVTTRRPRDGEIEGVDYFFVSVDEFKKLIDEEKLLEWAKVHDNYYGSLRSQVLGYLDVGTNVILDVDEQGAEQLVDRLGSALLIYIVPQSLDELLQRLKKRDTDSSLTIRKRLKNANEQIKKMKNYHAVIVNDDVETATRELIRIVEEFLRGGYPGDD